MDTLAATFRNEIIGGMDDDDNDDEVDDNDNDGNNVDDDDDDDVSGLCEGLKGEISFKFK